MRFVTVGYLNEPNHSANNILFEIIIGGRVFVQNRQPIDGDAPASDVVPYDLYLGTLVVASVLGKVNDLAHAVEAIVSKQACRKSQGS